MRDHILFHVNGREHRVQGAAVFATLSNWLRYDEGATGTKIVCEEGDCGACTVLIRRSAAEEFVPVNSCIQAIFQLDGASIVTVEGLKDGAHLSAVQEAMVALHGAQCGFCTPGFVVAMSAMYEEHDRVDEAQVRDALTGNLCRCTGYEPIIKAALSVDGASMPKLRERYPSLPDVRDAVRVGHFFAPASLEDAVRFKAEHPGCTIVQGGTDVGVWINKRNFRPPAVLSLAKLSGLDRIEMEGAAIAVGGRVTLAAFHEFIGERIPGLSAILDLFGSPQIRNAGTLAGNIANGSPIADTLPYLFVSGVELELTGLAGTRRVAVDKFYLAYKTFDLGADELITRILIPPTGDDVVKLYKVSRRKDLDISAFTAAIRLRMSGNAIESARIAYGGVGPLVLRLPRTEAFVTGKPASLVLFEEAGRIARGEIAPITDVRGSKDYRLQLAENILPKFWYEAFAEPMPPVGPVERRGPDRPFSEA
ncbi:MAG: molybdopterin dehydrogenase FAD-binding protein [Acidobacteria bacterium]|nr:molybdopterin dehydrogenase FAD-binding protein [Acidobacteriota bacterium]